MLIVQINPAPMNFFKTLFNRPPQPATPDKPKVEQEQKSVIDNWIETEFNAEYDAQIKVLLDLHLLDLLPDSEKMGIRGIDGNEYPVPSKEAIVAEIKSNPEKYETKIKQGFVKIQLTPFALPLERLTATLTLSLLDHYKRKKLLVSNLNRLYPDKPIVLNTKEPVVVNDNWIDPSQPEGKRGADTTGQSVYYPTFFDGTLHGGYTKADILKVQKNSPLAGWEIKLMEPIDKTSMSEQIKFKLEHSGRQKMALDKTPEQYLDLLQTDPQYAGEQGLTNEDWLMQFLIHLEQTNQIIDDSSGGNRTCLLIGSFNPMMLYVGSAFWESPSYNSPKEQAELNCCTFNFQYNRAGFRTAVLVRPELPKRPTIKRLSYTD